MGVVPRIVIAGLGDTGLLAAIKLAGKAGRGMDVIAISATPGLVSGQELGLRLARPDEWARDYRIGYDRFRRLDDVRVVHASLTGVDVDARAVHARLPDGTQISESFDVLIIATGVSNGFWRTPTLQTAEQVDDGLRAAHRQLAAAGSIAVVGGGAAAVSAAYNAAARWPDKQVDLYFPGERALVQHHPKVWDTLVARLGRLGVRAHPGHRAVVPVDSATITSGEIRWSTGQPDARADAVLWTVGRVAPNTDWLPPDWLDDDGFVQVDAFLRVNGREHIYAIGDVAATGPLRNSARGRADGLLVRNIVAGLNNGRLKGFREAPSRWGSVVGPQDDVLEVFAPSGRGFRIPAWSRWQPFLVRRSIYKGIRDA